ncbi:MAG: carboxypeptidase regulatory-like domain-containing protein [Gemmatimonadaceae bacterium]|jgi:hypothetical protein|nr:carboxypeptidase regulatory-like domain-containing protein [Gemmatimonadaceae bacterium]
MYRLFRAAPVAALLLTVVTALPLARAAAQGNTTGAISGVVRDKDGKPIDAATVVATNAATGFRVGVQTRENGFYTLQGLESGNYTVQARLIGYRPEVQQAVPVRVSQNIRIDFSLERQAAVLSDVIITSSRNADEFNPGRTGAQTKVSDTLVSRLPNINRNITTFIQLAPQVATNPLSGGVSSFAGQNARYNNIQVDGLTAVDRFGLNSDQQLGAQANGRGLTLEAVKEFQILLSPFDVRQGNFTGGLTNVVTKNGTNTWTGSFVFNSRNEALARDDPFIRTRPFDQQMYAGSLGGPLIKDKMHFFVGGDVQQAQTPAGGPYVGQAANAPVPVPVAQSSIDRFNAALQRFGIAGGSGGLVTNRTPLVNLFARVDYQLGERNRLVVRNSFNRNQTQDFGRSNALTNPIFNLDSWRFNRRDVSNSFGVQLFTTFAGGASNEFQVGLNSQRFERILPQTAPAILVENVPNPNGGLARLQAGSENSSQGNSLDQDILEIVNNFTLPIGRHTLTFGTRNEIYRWRNVFTQNSFGNWVFSNLDNFERGVARSFQVGAPVPNGGSPIAEATAGQFSLYVQDQWAVSDRVTISAGIRGDALSFFDQPTALPRLQQDFGLRTDALPTFRVTVSPRVGFNWDVTGDLKNQIRGGLGLFQGPPPFVFLSNNYTNTGNNFSQLTCDGAAGRPAPPTFAGGVPPAARCADGSGIREIPASGPLPAGVTVGTVNAVADNLRLPQVLRASLAYDRSLPWDVIASVEGTYTYGFNDFFYTRPILGAPAGTDRNGRTLYGTLSTGATGGVAAPVLRSREYNDIVLASNVSGAWSTTLTTQLRKRFSQGWEGSVAYTYQQARTVQDLTSSVARSNWNNGRVNAGDQLDERIGISAFQMPHRVVLTGTYTTPFKALPTDISLVYTGQAGTPLTFTATGAGGRGDLNSDGQGGNDPIYVPRNASDAAEILFRDATFTIDGQARAVTAAEQAAAFDRFINAQSCLASQRGRIMDMNSCRNPWWSTLDLTLRQQFPQLLQGRFSIEAQVFNLPNLINENWGKIRTRGQFPQSAVLTHVGQGVDTQGRAQSVFNFNPAEAATPFPIALSPINFYQIQIGARFGF